MLSGTYPLVVRKALWQVLHKPRPPARTETDLADSAGVVDLELARPLERAGR